MLLCFFFILLRHISFSVVLQRPCLISRHGCHTRSPFDEGEGRGKKLKSSPFSKKKWSLEVDGNNFWNVLVLSVSSLHFLLSLNTSPNLFLPISIPFSTFSLHHFPTPFLSLASQIREILVSMYKLFTIFLSNLLFITLIRRCFFVLHWSWKRIASGNYNNYKFDDSHHHVDKYRLWRRSPLW